MELDAVAQTTGGEVILADGNTEAWFDNIVAVPVDMVDDF